MAYKVLDVARYIINYSNNREYGISNLKLQKLLYFVQAEFLAFSDEKTPCFDEEIEAWGFGPVVPCVYQEYKQFGSASIPTIEEYYEMSDDWEMVKRKFTDSCILNNHKNLIDEIVDGFSEYSATALVNITHQQKPWSDVYEEGMNQIITKNSIRRYFEEDGN